MNDKKKDKCWFKEKLRSIKWFSHKRRWFIYKHILIFGILGLLFYMLLIHYHKSEDNIYSLISNFSLNFSFILIPALLYLIEIRRNFKNKFNNIFTLKSNLIYLRRFIANELSGMKNKRHRDIIIDPYYVNQIVDLLRKFNFNKHATMFLSHIEMKRLYNIDLIIIDVIKKIKNYDSGKDYESMEKDLDFKYTKNNIENLKNEGKTQELKKLFLNDLTYPLVHYFLQNKTNAAFAHYYDILDTYPNESYQKIIYAIQDILKYNVNSEGVETQIFDVNIVSAIRLLDKNQQKLKDLGMYFNFNIEKGEALIIILSEPCDLFRIKIKMGKTFKVNTAYDKDLKSNKDWVKENMIAHLQNRIRQFNLILKDEDFWYNS